MIKELKLARGTLLRGKYNSRFYALVADDVTVTKSQPFAFHYTFWFVGDPEFFVSRAVHFNSIEQFHKALSVISKC